MHKSVLLEECLSYLNLKEDSVVVDCTLGYGGHSSEILKKIKKGFLYAFDQDSDAITFSKECLSQIGNNFEIISRNFVYLKEEMNKRSDKVDGILYDLGVSSPQLDVDWRGFSFHHDALLDMRMDRESSLTAFVVVNTYSYEDLVRILRDYGEEKYAVQIASHIVKARSLKEIQTTFELVEIIKKSVPMKYSKDKHPARKTFQAIRIEVNHELEVFEKSLRQALECISVGGRICVITFHSLEDRICKEIFKEVSLLPKELEKLPVVPLELLPKFKIVGSVKPSKEELEENNRARSAKLRIIERVR